jgi:hypothetical protein
MIYSQDEIEAIARLIVERGTGKLAKPPAGELNRQQICAALGVSESTIRRLEQSGLPFTPVGVRSKRYDLLECKNWLKEHNQCPSGTTKRVENTSALWSGEKEFTESYRKVQLRVMPSASKRK